MKNCTTTRWRYRSKTVVAFAVASLVLCGVPLFGQTPDVVVQWNNAALQGVRDSKIGPPMVARALFIVHNCIYDAWAAYDKSAVGTVFGSSLRRPKPERTLANKNQAISFAAYRAAVDLFPEDKTTVFDPLMADLGYDINDNSTNAATPAGIGNVACGAILAIRHNDGSNQLGNLAPSGIPYDDYTGYVPSNPATTVPLGSGYDYSSLNPNHWQPLTYFNGIETVTPSFVGAQWYKVTPFAMGSADEFLPFIARVGPALYPSKTYLKNQEVPAAWMLVEFQHFLLGSELAHLSDVLRLQGDLAGATKLAEESLAISREAQNKRGTARSLHSLASSVAQGGDIAGARKMYEEALATRNELGYKGMAAETTLQLAVMAIEEGNSASAEATSRDTRAEFQRLHQPEDEIAADAVLARALLAMGRPSDAQKEIDAGKTLLTKSQDLETHFQLGIVASRVEAALGKNASAANDLESVLAGASKHKYLGYQLEARLALGEIETGSGKIAAGNARLTALQKDAAAQGFLLIARKAARAHDGNLDNR